LKHKAALKGEAQVKKEHKLAKKEAAEKVTPLPALAS